MKYVEFCKLCLSRPGKLKTKFDLNVLCIFSYVAFFILVPIGTDTLYVSVDFEAAVHNVLRSLIRDVVIFG